MSRHIVPIIGLVACLVGACAHSDENGVAAGGPWEAQIAVADPAGIPQPVAVHQGNVLSWGEPMVVPAGADGPQIVADTDGRYLLDTGDRLRIFVYGQPNLSRLYAVDHEGKVSIPLIGNITARGKTTYALEAIVRQRLGTQYVKDPQVTVDIQQNRPFFILGEVRTAGAYPYLNGITIEQAVAIAGGYSERANERRSRITRRINGLVEVLEVPPDYVVQPGDSVYVFERIF
jgi:polysaccharide biosynthesis/export protein